MIEPFAVEPFAVEIERDTVKVTGAEAVSFLQGQLSQDIVAIDVGASAWSFLLQPQGKVDAWLRVSRLAEDEVLLDVDAGFGAAVIERLERFKLRTKATITALSWRCIAIRGTSLMGGQDLALDAVLALDPGWPHVEGIDLVGEDPRAPDGVPGGSLADYEALRIECGVPSMGRELTKSTIPAEAGVVERSVSFTKGCYTGQELVARIDSRGGNVPRHLRGLVLEGSVIPVAGTPVLVGGGEVGSITSAQWSPRFDRPVALAIVKRSVEVPAAATVDGAVAQIEALPLLRSAV